MKRIIKEILSALLFIALITVVVILDSIVMIFIHAFSKTWLLFPLCMVFVLLPCFAYYIGRVILKDWL